MPGAEDATVNLDEIGNRPRMSVLIATYNRARLLELALESLARQTYPRDLFEIVVADNGSTDDTRATVERAGAASASRVRYLSIDTPGKSHAINAALPLVSSDVVVFTDDDVQAEPGWLEGYARAFAETGADFAAGRILPLWEAPPPSWMSPALYGALAVPDGGPVRCAIASAAGSVMPIGANMAVRRRVIEALGGWRTDLGKLRGSLRTGEDHEFFLRMLGAGCRGVYEPSARVCHLVPRTRLDRTYFRKWYRQNGADVATIERAYPTTTRYLVGVPRYLWRNATRDLCRLAMAAAKGDRAGMFAGTTRLTWFVGFTRAAWRGRSRPATPVVRDAMAA